MTSDALRARRSSSRGKEELKKGRVRGTVRGSNDPEATGDGPWVAEPGKIIRRTLALGDKAFLFRRFVVFLADLH
jgi:hypothetical protein